MLDRGAARIEGGREVLARLFLIRIQDCSRYCELISHPSQKPRLLEIAIRTAIARRGVDHGDVLLLLGIGHGLPLDLVKTNFRDLF